MLVVKNYDGASKEDFVHNKNQYRTIFVQGDGDAKTLETPLDVEAVDKHLQRLREDIYEFGQGVNVADKDIRDTSGVALRFMYADLDMDCVDWGNEVEWSIGLLVWFIQQDILSKKGVDYEPVSYSVLFNTDIIVNETETITNCMNSVGVISPETIAANHPWVLDAKKEIAALREDDADTLDLEAEYAIKQAVAVAKARPKTTGGGSK
jgi:SPP1 family phage portal protein